MSRDAQIWMERKGQISSLNQKASQPYFMSYHLLIRPETSKSVRVLHIWVACTAKRNNLLLTESWTQIAGSPSCMQSPSGHTLYFVADLTHIICIYSGFIPPPCRLSIFLFSAHADKKNKTLLVLHLDLLLKANGGIL